MHSSNGNIKLITYSDANNVIENSLRHFVQNIRMVSKHQ